MRIIAFAISLALTAAFTWLFLTRYWFWRDCIDQAASSCITPDGTNLTSGGMVWIVPAIGFAILAFFKRPR